MPNRDFLTREEFAAYVGVHPITIDRWSRDSYGPRPFLYGGLGPCPCYWRSEVEQFVAGAAK